MAGDVVIKDRLTRQDFRNLAAFKVGIKVLLDLTHPKSTKPMHLDIELDFNKTEPEDLEKMLSQLKQKYASTYGKFLFKKFDPAKKHFSAKYEVPAFGGSVISEASNKVALAQAIKDWDSGKVAKSMLPVEF